jgi:hypothetical protein
MRRSKRWFGPRLMGMGFAPVSWEGWVLTFALFLGLGLAPLVAADRRWIVMMLMLLPMSPWRS